MKMSYSTKGVKKKPPVDYTGVDSEPPTGGKRKTGKVEVAMMRGEVSSEKSNDLNLIILRKGKGMSHPKHINVTPKATPNPAE